MTVPGYLSTSKRHPVSLGLAVALTGAALTALLLVKPMVQNIVPETKLTTREIAIDVPPPPLPPKRVQQQQQPQQQQVDRVAIDYSHPTLARNDDIIPESGSITGIDFGYGSTIKIDPVLAAEPVLTDAMPDPRFAGSVQPPYPPSLQRQEIEGAATVRVQIGVDGRVLRVESVAADNEGFLVATRDWAMRHWRFKPAMRDGVPVVGWKTLTVRFRISR